MISVRTRIDKSQSWVESLYRCIEQLEAFLARDSIYAIARYMPSPVRPSVRLPSVCHTGGSVKDGWS